MEIVNDISKQIIDLCAPVSGFLGMFFIPCVILAALLLLLFSKVSYRLLKIVLPLSATVLGAISGAGLIAPYVESAYPQIAEYADPTYVCMGVLAVVIALISFKSHTSAVLLVGACVGYEFIGRLAKDLLLSIPFILRIANDVIRLKSYTVGVIVCIIAMVVCAFLVHKYFKRLYVIVTSVGVSVAAVGAACALCFANTTFLATATLVGALVGLVIGMVFCYKQLGEVYADY